MLRVLVAFLMLICLTYPAKCKITVFVENAPVPGLDSFLAESLKNYESFNGDTVKISFGSFDGSRFISVDFFSDSLAFTFAPYPGVVCFRDEELDAIVNFIGLYSYEVNKMMSYYMESVLFCHYLRCGKQIKGAYYASSGQRISLLAYRFSYLVNYKDPLYVQKTVKGKKKNLEVPRSWKDAFVDYARLSFVLLKDDNEFLDYISDIN